MTRSFILGMAIFVMQISQSNGYQSVSKMSELTTVLNKIGGTEDGVLMTKGNYILNSDLTIDKNVSLKIERGAIFILGNYKLILNAELDAGLYQIFNYSGSGVAKGNIKIKAVYPQWWGAHSITESGFSSFDSTEAIQYAVDFADVYQSGTGTVKITEGSVFLASQIRLKAATALIGDGLWSSILKAKGGIINDAFIRDDGNAAKIVIEDIGIYGNNELGYTAGIDLGNQSGGVQWGTEGLITNTIVRDFPNGYGFRLDGNVGVMIKNSVWKCKGTLYLKGAANQIISLIDSGCTEYGMYLESPFSYVTDYYSEPNQTGTIPIYFGAGNMTVNNACVSLDVNITTPCIAKIDSVKGSENILSGVTSITKSGASIAHGVVYTNVSGNSSLVYDLQQDYTPTVPATITLNQNYIASHKTGDSTKMKFPILKFYGVIPSTLFMVDNDVKDDIILEVNCKLPRRLTYTYTIANNSTTKTIWFKGEKRLFSRIAPSIYPITDSTHDLNYSLPVRPETTLTIKIGGIGESKLIVEHTSSIADFGSSTYGPYATGVWLKGEQVYQKMEDTANNTSYKDVIAVVCTRTGNNDTPSDLPTWKKIKLVD